MKAKFENKAPLRPVTSLNVWERIQIDLMSMMDVPIVIEGNTFQWILSIIIVTNIRKKLHLILNTLQHIATFKD